ncbi:MAG TPA: hypothetical protein VGB49_05035 [Caulobacteraceae bacterium]|jgi:hypothetical protein
MSVLKVLMAAAALLALSAPVAAQTPPDGFTWMVLNRLNDVYSDPDDPTNRPPLITEVPAGVLIAQDISHDGVADWLIAWPQASQFCGTGGCRKTLYVSGSDGYRRVFDQQSLDDLTIVPGPGGSVVEAWVHHLGCRTEREKCLVAWRWDDALGRLVDHIASDGSMEPRPDPVPGPASS